MKRFIRYILASGIVFSALPALAVVLEAKPDLHAWKKLIESVEAALNQ